MTDLEQRAADVCARWGLTPTEARLFARLEAAGGMTVLYRTLAEHVWGTDGANDARVLSGPLTPHRPKPAAPDQGVRVVDAKTFGYRLEAQA
jgi:DNA-binding response OmpR family regulator